MLEQVGIFALFTYILMFVLNILYNSLAWTIIYGLIHIKQYVLDFSGGLLSKLVAFLETIIVIGLSFLIFSSSTIPYVSRLDPSNAKQLPSFAREYYDQYGSRYHLTSSYGLFASMTTERYEIILEGSNDGVKWIPYEFYYKPGDVNRPPPIVGKPSISLHFYNISNISTTST
jgi:hypothetical protein